MLFNGGVRRAGDDFLHLFSAAYHRYAAVPDHGDDVSAVLTDEKPLFHDSSLLHFQAYDSKTFASHPFRQGLCKASVVTISAVR